MTDSVSADLAAELDTARRAIHNVRCTMDALRWWLCQTENGKDLDNAIWRALQDVPEED